VARRDSGTDRGGERVRLLLYSHPFAPQVGGLERLTHRTAELLAARGVGVDVVTDAPEGDGPTASRSLPSYRLHRRPSLRRLWQLIRDADIVHLNSFDIRVFLLAAALRRPIVWQHVDYHTICPRGTCIRCGVPCSFTPLKCWRCLRSDHGRLEACRVLSAFGAKVLASWQVRHNIVSSDYSAMRLHLRHSVQVSLGVDVNMFSPRPRRPREDGWFVAVFFGRHIAAKGCHVLIHALRACARDGVPVRAIIAGDGPERAALQRLALEEEVGDRVDFRGFVGDGDLVRLVNEADAVVVPAIHDEYFGLVAAEAMSCGVPVVASSVGSLPEVVADCGLLFPAGDAERLAGCLEHLARQRDLGPELGRRARKLAMTRLSDEGMVDSYMRLYGNLRRCGSRSAEARSA